MIDFSLYLIAHAQSDFKVILQAIEGGVTIVQLRDKKGSAQELLSRGKQLLAMLRPIGIPLIINDRVDVAYQLQADGVHLGQSDLDVTLSRTILGKSSIIGLSVETIDQAIEAEGKDVDYLAASPVFYTKTKSNCAPPWGLNGLKHLCAISSHPIIAVGGIDETNSVQVTKCGIAGVAIVSAILNAPCPKTAAQNISNKIHDGKKSAV